VRLEERLDLAALLERGAIEQLRVIYSPEGQTLDVRQPMTLGDEAFGSIRIGVSTLLMRQEVNAALRPALLTGAVALGVAVLVAALLAQLLLRPIHVIRSGLTRLGKGEFGVTLDLQGLAWEAQWDLGKGDPATAQDVFVMYWWPTYVTPYDFLFNMFHSEEQPLFNLGYYRSAAFDQTIDGANEVSGADKAAAEAMFRTAAKTLVDEAVALFFFDQDNIHVVRSDIQGYVDNPAYSHVVFIYQLSR